jgi:tRNA modification GTPase
VNRTPNCVACLTPPGTGAIATIGVFGPDAWQMVVPLLRPPLDPAKLGPQSYRLARFGDGELIDTVVITLDWHGTTSRVELHCHGGVAVVRWILELLQQRGAVPILWQDWVRHTSESPIRAAAAIALAHAVTARTAGILLHQYHGALDAAFQDVERSLAGGELERATLLLTELVRFVPLGRHLTAPWRVVLAGAPNVGKSTLVNALLGYQRALTSPIAGTTRDALRSATAFDGWPVELVDTAGLVTDAAELEAAGIEMTVAALGAADLVLWVLDASQPAAAASSDNACPILRVYNKIDLLQAGEQPAPDDTPCTASVSALTGEGLPALIEKLTRMLVPNPPSSGAAVPFAPQHFETLEAALALVRGRDYAAASEKVAALRR